MACYENLAILVLRRKRKYNCYYLLTSENHLRRPVMLKMNTTPEVVKPADIVSAIENLRAIATAAIA